MKLCYLFLVLTVTNCQVFNVNWLVDLGLYNTNEFIRHHNFTTAFLPEGSFGPNIEFAESLIIGFDSAKRTGNCTVKVQGKNATIELHYGLGLFQQTFLELKINATKMSASYRIRDNSLYLVYTIHNETTCFVTLDTLKYLRLAKVDFYSSRPEYDGKNVDKFFGTELLPFLNKSINKTAVETSVQAICKVQAQTVADHLPVVHMAIIQNAKGQRQ